MPTRRLLPTISTPARRAGPGAPDAGRDGAATGRDARPVAAEVALGLVTISAVVGLHRLFVDGSYRAPLLVQALGAHVVVAVLRRRGIRLVPAAMITLAVGAIALAWSVYPETTRWLVPTGETLQVAGGDLGAAWRLFGQVRAPAPVVDGFAAAAGVAVWTLVFVADWAAFRAAATFEALLPSATLFLFGAALGAPGGRVAGAALYAAAALGFVLVQRTLAQEATATWVASHRQRGRWSLLGTGAALVGIAVVAGAAAGPNLPGADAEGVLAWRDAGDDDTRVVVSPLVDIQTRLVEQADVELFTVRSPTAGYWRLTALDEFDGQIWRSSYGTDDADGELPRAVDAGVETETVTQTFDVSALAAVWLPAAYEPVAIDAGGNEIDWDAESSTLMVDKTVDSSDGFGYQVQSDIPLWSADELRTATGEVPGDIAERYLRLPDDLDPAVAELARDITDGQPTPYDKALALQNHLRDFTYDLTVPTDQGSDALTTFLFETRRGYCQQFSGAFAAMARAIGIPTRVAVGFTRGIQDPNDPTLFRVRGEHAHAWDEIYLDGYGWVIMDPTPGRAPPRAEQWLGIPEQQDSPTGDGAVAVTPPGAATEPGPGATDTAGSPPGNDRRDRMADLDAPTTSSPSGSKDPGLFAPLGRIALTLGLAVTAYVIVTPMTLGLHRARRRRRASTPTAEVRLAWTDTLNAATAANLGPPPSLTVTETAERLAAELPDTAAAVRTLAATVEHATYAEVTPSPDESDTAAQASAVIRAALRARQPLARRVARHLDIRQLRSPRRSHPRPASSNHPAPAPAR